MPDLTITIEKGEALPYAVTPTIALKLRVANANPEEEIHTVVLRCQIQIEASRRRYSAAEQANLLDLFGAPERWGQTVKNLLWANTSTVATRFAGSSELDVHVPCTFDFCIATTKFFSALSDGDIPILVMFSGTVFYADTGGDLRVSPIPWNTEARFRLPVKVWKDMMDLYYPNSAWLCLRRDVFDQLHRYKIDRGIPTWEQALELLMAEAQQEAVGS